MQKVYFCAGNTFLTGDSIADAVLGYAASLARTAEFGVVHLPTRREDGSEGRTTLVLTPVSQISSESVASESAEVVDEELVAGLQARTALLLDPPPPAFEADHAFRHQADLLDI